MSDGHRNTSHLSEVVIQKPPTKEILALCDDSDALIESYLACHRTVRSKVGRFEAEVEAYTILKLLIRHLESVCQLARHDLVMLPSALVVARAAFEASIRGRWMLQPVDPFEREVRWVLHMRSAAEHFGKLEKNPHVPPAFSKGFADNRNSYQSFDSKISKLLVERGYTVPKQAPNIWEMLKALEEPHLYLFYIQLSAYTHTNYEAGSLYRKNLGEAKRVGEYIAPTDWHLPLDATWKSFFFLAKTFLYWIEADMKEFKAAESLAKDFNNHLSQLRQSR